MRAILGGAVAVATAATLLGPTAGAEASLYKGPGSRPGPDLLYEQPAVAPQLQNRGVWRARPILVSGTTAYRRGEFLYQDFLYDDSGARYGADPDDPRQPVTLPDPNDPRSAGNLFSRPNGTYTYPADPAYAHNAADLVELRVRPLRRATAFRVTLNTLKDHSLVAFTIAIGGREGQQRAFPHGANVAAPANLFLTVRPNRDGMVGELVRAATGEALPRGRVPARLDRRRRQIEVRVPQRVWNPRRRTVRLAAGVGLWDVDSGRYLLPGGSATESRPGGAGTASDPAAFFNVAFRTDEPFPSVTESEQAVLDAAWWRDRAQGAALRRGDISEFFARVDFRKLRRRARDNSAVPRRGPMNRILASRFELAQGADFSRSCFIGSGEGPCPGQYLGRLQPYAIYVPRGRRPQRGWGMTLLLHSLSANYNQYLGSRNQSQFGDRGGGSIVITPEARGPDGFYESYAAADVFEVWADVARRYRLDPAWTVATGYSMGGIGSFKLAAQFPDLFARIQPTVGYEGNHDVLASLRHVPVTMWNNHGDELVNNLFFQETADALDALGYRYDFWAFQPCLNPACPALFPNHLQLAVNDHYGPAADWLGRARVERNPARVTYVLEPARNNAELRVVGDHAYWVSRLRPRSPGARGRIDVRSHGFGVGDAEPSSTSRALGTLTGGNLGTLAYTSQRKTWGRPPSVPRENRLDITASGIASARIDVRRARVDCDVDVRISSDGPLAVRLRPCGRTVSG